MINEKICRIMRQPNDFLNVSDSTIEETVIEEKKQ